MKSRHYRWLSILLATSIAGGIVAGCGEDDWQHPNRVLHPAPPEKTTDTMSIDELERAWRQQDLEAERAARGQQDEPKDRRPEAAVTISAMLEAAIEYLEGAVDGQKAAESSEDAVGGGPPPSVSSSSDSGSSEM